MGRGSAYKVEGGANKSMLQVLASEVTPAVLILEGQHLADGTWYLDRTPRISFARPYFSQRPAPWSVMGSPVLRCGQPLNLDYHDSTVEQHSQ
jgi:hypothetical protein